MLEEESFIEDWDCSGWDRDFAECRLWMSEEVDTGLLTFSVEFSLEAWPPRSFFICLRRSLRARVTFV